MKKNLFTIIAGYVLLIIWGFAVFQLTQVGEWLFSVIVYLFGNSMMIVILILLGIALKWIIYPAKGKRLRVLTTINVLVLTWMITPLLFATSIISDYSSLYQDFVISTESLSLRLLPLEGGIIGVIWMSILQFVGIASSRWILILILLAMIALSYVVATIRHTWAKNMPKKAPKSKVIKKQPARESTVMTTQQPQIVSAPTTNQVPPSFESYDPFKESAIRTKEQPSFSSQPNAAIKGTTYDPFSQPVFAAPTAPSTPTPSPTNSSEQGWSLQRQTKREPSATPVSQNATPVAAVKQVTPAPVTPPTLFDTADPTNLAMSDTKSSYSLPSYDLLNQVIQQNQAANIEEAAQKAILLNEKFKKLGIRGYVKDYIIAPSFTRFQIITEQDYRIDQLNTFQNDLKMAVSAEKISIQTPIPGTSYSGVDIPNKFRTMVGLRQVLPTLVQPSSPGDVLRVPLGIDIMGNVRHIDIDKAPHLLIAGATGSGKSACINSMLVSILMRTYPEQVRLVMIDPKRVEMLAFSQVPHLLCPVITDVQKAEVALQKLTEVMDERYTEFGRYAVKNIDSYNRVRVSERRPTMPYIVVFIDELADLILTTRDVESHIQRLTQLARASGIHVVVATQRPSVDVITPVIKSNITSRIAFAVATAHDSRTIFNYGGAEDLLGKGDMLLSFNGEINNSRIQGAFISDEEVLRVTQDLKAKAQPVFDPNFLDLTPPQAVDAKGTFAFDGDEGEDDDERLYKEIRAFIVQSGRVSTSMLQRRFSLGHPRASKMIDRMELEGVISPLISGNQRQVLVKSLSELEDE